MSLFNMLSGQYIDVIEWVDATTDTLIWKFPHQGNEIKMGAKLTVRESQLAVFLNEGKIADVYKPGLYTLSTENMPIMTELRSWKYGFNSPFKADVYFISTHQFLNQKWGTPNPVLVRDAEFGPVRLRAFGSFAFKVSDGALFFKGIAGTDPNFTTEMIDDQIRNIVITHGMNIIAQSHIPVLDLTSNYDTLSSTTAEKLKPEFTELGLELTKFLIENISVPPEVEAALDKRSSIGIMGNLNNYTQYQAATALDDEAKNPGMGGSIMGMGMGMGMANQVSQVMQQSNVGAPPPIVQYFVAINGQQAGPFNTAQLQQMAAQGQLTQQSMVWKQGMANWMAAETQHDLQAMFAPVPPPLPTMPPPINQ